MPEDDSARALRVAESGARLAYRELAASNFHGRTHDGDGVMASSGLIEPTLETLVRDDHADNGLTDERDDGWFVWEWNPGDPPDRSPVASRLPQSFRFSVRPLTPDPTEDEYVIDVVGNVGRASRRIRIQGYTEPAFAYALFSNGSLSEFVRGENQHVTGKVHANGDLFFRPSGTTLTIDSPSVTCTGQMVRTTDAWGRKRFTGNTVLIRGRSGAWVEMPGGAPGTAMDSEHPDWANEVPGDGIEGATERWGGVVRDGSLGAIRVDPPPVETFAPGGYYDRRATLRLRAGDVQLDQVGNDVSAWLGPAITQKTFYNAALEREVTVQEIDLAQLRTTGNWPSNGLIYSEVPVRIVNGDELEDDLTIVANHSVYTQGDFNRLHPRAAAILSSGRVWHLSAAWSDDESATRAPASERPAAAGTTVIRAAIVDGVPTVNEANFADLDGDGLPDDPTAGDARANSDHLLETWGSSSTLRKRGSVVHLQFANMAHDVRNAGIRPDQVAWTRHSAYHASTRDSRDDPSFSRRSGQPPFAPLVSTLFLWQEIQP